MPIYSYLCSGCEEKFDMLVGVTSEAIELKCPKCGSKKVKKTLTTFSVHTKSEEPACATGACQPVGCPTCH
jgi:putative FmdB family regulatory protein